MSQLVELCVIDQDGDMVDAFNGTIAKYAERIIAYHEKAAWVEELAKANDGP